MLPSRSAQRVCQSRGVVRSLSSLRTSSTDGPHSARSHPYGGQLHQNPYTSVKDLYRELPEVPVRPEGGFEGSPEGRLAREDQRNVYVDWWNHKYSTALVVSGESFNTLSYEFMEDITQALDTWSMHPTRRVLFFKSLGPVFLRGWDTQFVANAHRQGHPIGFEYLRSVQAFVHRMAGRQLPMVIRAQGHLSGPGLAIAANAQFQNIPSDATMSVPECGMGWFPDCGNTKYLSELPGCLGTYLALTGQHCDYSDLVFLGIANRQYFNEDHIRDALDDVFYTAENRETPLKFLKFAVEESTFVEERQKELDEVVQKSHLAKHRQQIEWIFNVDTVEEVYARLTRAKKTKQGDMQFVQQCIDQLETKSPFSLKLTLRMLRRAQKEQWHTEECIRREFRAACHILSKKNSADFLNAVQSRIVEGQQPTWTSSLDSVSVDEIDSILDSSPSNGQEDLNIKPVFPINNPTERLPDGYTWEGSEWNKWWYNRTKFDTDENKYFPEKPHPETNRRLAEEQKQFAHKYRSQASTNFRGNQRSPPGTPVYGQQRGGNQQFRDQHLRNRPTQQKFQSQNQQNQQNKPRQQKFQRQNQHQNQAQGRNQGQNQNQAQGRNQGQSQNRNQNQRGRNNNRGPNRSGDQGQDQGGKGRGDRKS